MCWHVWKKLKSNTNWEKKEKRKRVVFLCQLPVQRQLNKAKIRWKNYILYKAKVFYVSSRTKRRKLSNRFHANEIDVLSTTTTKKKRIFNNIN